MRSIPRVTAGLALALSALVAWTVPASAANPVASWPASCQLTQTSLNLCASKYLTIANTQLHAWLNRERAAGFLTSDINAVERQWEAYRTAECTMTSRRYQNGTIYPLTFGLCEITMTQARIAQIRDDIAALKNP